MDKCREEFEAHFKNTLFYANMLISLKQSGIDAEPFELRNGQYRNAYVQLAYSTWSVQQAKVEGLQKRVDAALQEIKGAARWINEDAIDDSEFIKGGALHALKRLEQALKGEAND